MRHLFLFIILAGFMAANNQEGFTQNYWGEGYIQPVKNKQVNTVAEKPKPKETTENVKKYQPVDIPEQTVKTTGTKTPLLELGTSTEKIPAGAKLTVVMNTTLNSKKNHEGDPFSATVKEDVKVENSIIMPAGTLIRGRIGKVKKPGIFSKSGSIVLNFDHIVTPLGKHISLDVDLSESNKINKKGALIANDGFSGAIKDSARTSINTTKKIAKAGYDAGMAAGVVPVIVTVPTTATAGALAGTTIFATKSTIAIFKKGGNPVILPGDCMEITFSDELDVPVN